METKRKYVSTVIAFSKTDQLLIENTYTPKDGVDVKGDKLYEVFVQEAVSAVLEELWNEFYKNLDLGEQEE